MIYTIIAIIFESIDSLFKGVKALLESKELTVGAILAGLAPFVWTLNRIRKEKEKRDRAKRVELRQLRIESKIDDLMRDRGVVSTWSFQEHGLSQEVPRSLKRLLSLLQEVTILRRKRFMNKLKSRKLWLTLLGVIIPVLNEEFGLNLDAMTIGSITASIIAGIIALAHVDAKKILAGLIHTKVTVKGLEVAFTTFQEAKPVLNEIHIAINKLLDDVKKDDGSQAFKDAMQAYAQIKPILDALKHPEPLVVIVEDKVAS